MYSCDTWYLLFCIQNSFRITNLFIYLFIYVFMRHMVNVILYTEYSFRITNLFIYLCIHGTFGICYSVYRITNTKCRMNTIVPPDDGPGEVRNM
jgi:hypothetical protein